MVFTEVVWFKATAGARGHREYLRIGKTELLLSAFLLGFRTYCQDVATVHEVYSVFPFLPSLLFSLLPSGSLFLSPQALNVYPITSLKPRTVDRDTADGLRVTVSSGRARGPPWVPGS